MRQGGLTERQKRENVVRLAFGRSEARFEDFCRVIGEEIPPGTGVILRGSAVTGCRWKDGTRSDRIEPERRFGLTEATAPDSGVGATCLPTPHPVRFAGS